MIIALIGVSGSGKTAVGRALAERLACPFVDADDFHPESNIEKMSSGEPLNDDDRRPWLTALSQTIDELCTKHIQVVLACSALKHDYQELLQTSDDCVQFVLLHGSFELIQSRIEQRRGHFMPAALLQSQFDTLELPEDAVQVDVTPSIPEIVDEIISRLHLQS
ncbi:gluconokinase [Thalassoroseus pseudoceratinae]|uniref:gluconokinase n=1 Tax=Thalassoroseus pseudoceratinae TaxID=2713176 RepID=UPI001981D6DE|nr:gluconokinase [Thalassoroseus pseudoceratinae]